jgi:rod shape determining protein RodA
MSVSGIVVRRAGRRFDWTTIVATVALLAVGIATLIAATSGPGEPAWNGTVSRQLIYAAIGLAAMGALAWFDPRWFERAAYPFHAVVLGLLVLVLSIGKVAGGSEAWIPIFGFHLQPSELAKLSIVLCLARWFADRPTPAGIGIPGLLKPALLFLVPAAGLIFVEPDLGQALFLCFVFAGIAFVVGLRVRTILALLVVGAIAAPLAYRHVLSDYQKRRVDTMLKPDADPQGAGWQVTQGQYAIGSGRWFGKGYREGTQGRLEFLPEHHTDFIFPIFAEEWGFVGSCGLLGAYLGLLMLGLSIARAARDRFASLLAAGIVTLLFVQITINLGGVLGLMPVTGVTLPFMSFGGSSLITLLAAMGMLLSVSTRRAGAQG